MIPTMLNRRRLLQSAAAAALLRPFTLMSAPDAASKPNPRQPLLARKIPRSGESLPAIGLGTWQSFDVAGNAAGLAEAREALARLVELGGSVVDSSPSSRNWTRIS